MDVSGEDAFPALAAAVRTRTPRNRGRVPGAPQQPNIYPPRIEQINALAIRSGTMDDSFDEEANSLDEEGEEEDADEREREVIRPAARQFSGSVSRITFHRRHLPLVKSEVVGESGRLKQGFESTADHAKNGTVVSFEEKRRLLYGTLKLFLESMEERHRPFTLVASRANLLSSAIALRKAWMKDRPIALVRVGFAGEEAVDGGGPAREWIRLLLAKLLNSENGVVEDFDDDCPQARGRYKWITSNNPDLAWALGAVVALAFLKMVKIDLPFSNAMYRLLGSFLKETEWASTWNDNVIQAWDDFDWKLADLEDVDDDLMRRLRDLLDRDMTESEVRQELGSASDMAQGTMNGPTFKIAVIKEQIRRKVINSHRGSGVAMFLTGFGAVFRQDTVYEISKVAHGYTMGEFLSWLHPEELRLSITGRRQVDAKEQNHLDNLSSVTETYAFNSAHPIHKEFWRLWSNWDQVQRQRVLHFATGSPHLPPIWEHYLASPRSSATRPETVPFALHFVDDPLQRHKLPWALTCASTLYLPSMPPEQLETRIKIALKYGDGYGMS